MSEKKVVRFPVSDEKFDSAVRICRSVLSHLSSVHIPRFNKLMFYDLHEMQEELERIKSECGDFIQELQYQKDMLKTERERLDRIRLQQ